MGHLLLFISFLFSIWGCGHGDMEKDTGQKNDELISGEQTERITPGADPLNLTYIIEGQEIRLQQGKAEKQAAPGSAAMIRTAVFGNLQYGDLNNDGLDDAVMFLLHSPGGSGTFYYAATALFDGTGWYGTEALFIGDRIVPKSIDIKDGLITVQYLDRRPDESFSSPATVETEKKMILDGNALRIINDD